MRSGLGRMLATLALFAAPALHAEPAITPRPLQVAEQAGPGVMLGDGTGVLAPAGDAEAEAVARYLADLAHRSGGVRLVPGVSAGAAPAIRLVRHAGFAPEGYALDIAATGATITASTHAGLLYGAVSLWQLLATARDHRLMPVKITDSPRFAWRGMLLDSVRHVRSTAASARMLDWMALHKLNRLQWHLADDQGWRIAVPDYPRLTSVAAWRTTPPAAGLTPGRHGGFYTPAEIRRIVALAAARNITVVPEIELPGHATAAILAYPDIGMTTMTAANLGDWGVFSSLYGVDAKTFAFLHSVLDQVMTLFPSREIAIGGDEAVHTLWHASPAVQARMHALGLKDEAALQGWFVGQIGAYLNAHGRRLVGWDEILADPALSRNDIVLSWHGADGAIAAARAGHDVVMATAPTLYFDNRQATGPSEPPGRGFLVTLGDVYAYDPGDPPHAAGTPGLDAAAARHVLGVQAQLWSEHIVADTDFEAMALPRAAALAEIGWTAAARRDWPDFVARLPALFAEYRALGLRADDGAVAVQAKIVGDRATAQVTLDRQIALGEIRYTIDGTMPTASSPRYTAPLLVSLPSHVRAASFAGPQQVSRAIDLPLDSVSATRKTSQQLELCGNAIVLNLPGHTAPGASATPAYLVDIRNPCWIDRAVDLSRGGHVAVDVVALPFNYQFADGAPARPAPPEPAELVLRRGCDGPVLATVPLAPVARDGKPHTLVASIAPQAGRQDLCIRLPLATRSPLWALDAVELRP
uniref:beta-N-acetylhexosaminidase n=1 Tax=uncultured Sphingomonas sp. TaxID=158754 RepID=UPI0035CC3B3E